MRHAVALRIAAVALLWLNLPGLLLGQGPDLGLKHGTYVQAPVSCKEPLSPRCKLGTESGSLVRIPAVARHVF